MQLAIDRFEDNELVVLETPNGEGVILPHTQVPWYASEGDVLTDLPEEKWQGEVRYAVDQDETPNRPERAMNLRASLPKADDGDLEL